MVAARMIRARLGIIIAPSGPSQGRRAAAADSDGHSGPSQAPPGRPVPVPPVPSAFGFGAITQWAPNGSGFQSPLPGWPSPAGRTTEPAGRNGTEETYNNNTTQHALQRCKSATAVFFLLDCCAFPLVLFVWPFAICGSSENRCKLKIFVRKRATLRVCLTSL